MTLMLAREPGLEAASLTGSAPDAAGSSVLRHPGPRASDRRLYTATLVFERNGEEVAMFHASHAAGRSELLEALGTRVPHAHLARVEMRPGIGSQDPIVVRLVPGAVLATLAECGDLCPIGRPFEDGGSLHIVEHSQIDPEPTSC